MAAEGVRIELKADAALAALARAYRQADNPRGLFDNIGMSLVVSTQARFDRGAGPDGSPWPPSLRAIAESGKTLIDSARLMQSITFEATDTGVAVGTNVIYAAVHQFGATIRPVKADKLRFRIGDRYVATDEVTIPARPFLGLDDDDEREIEAIAGDWLLGPKGLNDARR